MKAGCTKYRERICENMKMKIMKAKKMRLCHRIEGGEEAVSSKKMMKEKLKWREMAQSSMAKEI